MRKSCGRLTAESGKRAVLLIKRLEFMARRNVIVHSFASDVKRAKTREQPADCCRGSHLHSSVGNGASVRPRCDVYTCKRRERSRELRRASFARAHDIAASSAIKQGPAPLSTWKLIRHRITPNSGSEFTLRLGRRYEAEKAGN